MDNLPITFLQLRALIWKDGNTFMGQCLETGSVATADEFHVLRNMLYTLLVSEHDYNINGEGSLRNLFDTPAPREVWERYYQLSLNRSPDLVSGIQMLDATF